MDSAPPRPHRWLSEADVRDRVPVHVVWEITLACNLKCQHCGSRAGRPRPRELTTAECLEIVGHLARLGTREVTLIGGETYLRRDWTDIIREIRRHDMYCAIQTGGRNLTEARLVAAVDAGLQGVGVSIDGTPEVHDRLRGVRGSQAMAVAALRRARALGLRTSVTTSVSAANLRCLRALLDEIVASGATHWQVQLTVPMGNAADHDGLLLQPFQLDELMPLLAELFWEAWERGVLLVAGNNIGYFGPFEHLFRGTFAGQEGQSWSGCAAGRNVLALESDGTVKGCPSLATERYAAGDVRERPLEAAWAVMGPAGAPRSGPGARERLWGYCQRCYYAEVCGGGCTWTADSLFGRPGNNPYCHHRVLELKRRGLRERVVKRAEAPPTSFATGRFALVLEPVPGAHQSALNGPLDAEIDPARRRRSRSGSLRPCPACDRLIWPEEFSCPFCGVEMRAAAAAEAESAARRARLVARLEALLGSGDG